VSRFPAVITVVCPLFAVGCSTSKSTVEDPGRQAPPNVAVKTSYDPAARFPRSAFYGWETRYPKLPDDVRVDSLELEQRLRKAIRRVLKDKGYSHRGYSPDFRVGYRVAIVTDEFDPEFNARYRVRDGWLPAMANSRLVERGALMIDVVDAVSHRLVWQGVSEANVTMTADKATKHERLNRAVEEMFAEFPPGT
jgi:hypothetical protein